MPTIPKLNFNFSKGLNSDGGPFLPSQGFFKDGLNTEHFISGEVQSRRGIQLLNETHITTIDDQTDATNLFIPSFFQADFIKNDGTIINAILLRWGDKLKIYDVTLENLDIRNPSFSFNLGGVGAVSDQAWFYRSNFSQEGNTVIITNARSPIFKVIFGDVTTGSETFSVYRVELAEYNADLFDLTPETELSTTISGWFSKDIPLKTSISTYQVLDGFFDAVPGYIITAFLIKANGITTLVTGSVVYTETHDSDTNILTSSVTFSGGVNGDILRLYFGATTIDDFDASLIREKIIVSSRDKNFADDNSHSPRQVSQFAGRTVFSGVDGPLDETDDATFSTLGIKSRKIWFSELFPETLTKEEISIIRCHPKNSPFGFGFGQNLVLPTDGNVINIDDANRILDHAPYSNSLFVVATNGVWAITGPEEFFSLQQTIIRKIIDDTFSSREPIVSTEDGLFIFGDNEVYWIDPKNKDNPIQKLIENRIYDKYSAITLDKKKQAFTRYDNFTKRIYHVIPGTTTNNKFGVPGLGDEVFIYDIRTRSWLTNLDVSEGVWGIFDIITVSADSFFTSSDERFDPFKKISLVLLGKKNGNFTDITFGVLQGTRHCADYFGTSFVASFNSFIETFNTFGEEFGVGNVKQVARMQVFMKRQEQNDADIDGFYEFPGALYLSKRWRFADTKTAGPLFQFTFNPSTNAYDEVKTQIYFPSRLGLTVIGGGKPPLEVIIAKLKVRGRGPVVAFKFGNDFGTTTLTGTVEEQQKGWGLYGYQLDLKNYDINKNRV